jgi:hypothetical protein
MPLLRIYILVGCLILIIGNKAYSQNKSSYIVIDSAYLGGTVEKFGKDNIQFKRKKADSPVSYGPDEIKEFGIKGDVYKSIPIDGKNRFLKLLISGKTELYQYEDIYISRKGENIVPLKKENFKQVIQEYTIPEDTMANLYTLSYTQSSISSFISNSNMGILDIDKHPFRKVGLYTGYNFFQFRANYNGVSTLKTNASSPAIAFFLDMPLYKPKNLFINTELNWLYATPEFNYEKDNYKEYHALKIHGVGTLLNVKAIFSRSRTSKYLKAGMSIDYVSVVSEHELSISQNQNEININDELKINSSGVLIGFDIAGGLEFPLKNRTKIHTEIKYRNTASSDFEGTDLGYSALSILAGINF